MVGLYEHEWIADAVDRLLDKITVERMRAKMKEDEANDQYY